jgi:hypothetical protein
VVLEEGDDQRGDLLRRLRVRIVPRAVNRRDLAQSGGMAPIASPSPLGSAKSGSSVPMRRGAPPRRARVDR